MHRVFVLVLKIIGVRSLQFYTQDIDLTPEYPVKGDFKDVLESEIFLDKTDFIQAFLNHSNILLTAYPGFGKSTNLDMIKRFIEIPVDKGGHPIDIRTTLNYKLFTTNNLKVAKDQRLFNEYFGKYPVMHIDYSELCGSIRPNFDAVFTKLKKIQRKVFLTHKYLLNNTKLWSGNGEKELFYKFIESNPRTLDPQDVRLAFKFLSKLLYKHYNKPVVVLIDEIDTFLKTLAKTWTSVEDEIVNFISSVNDYLLKFNKNIQHVLIMGDIVQTDVPVHPMNMRKICVLYDENYWKYFGVGEAELEELLPKIVKDDEGREKMHRYLAEDKKEIQRMFQTSLSRLNYVLLKEVEVYDIYRYYPLTYFLHQNDTVV